MNYSLMLYEREIYWPFQDPVQDFTTPLKGLQDWFRGPKIDNKRDELRDLIIALKTKYETKTEEKS